LNYKGTKNGENIMCLIDHMFYVVPSRYLYPKLFLLAEAT